MDREKAILARIEANAGRDKIVAYLEYSQFLRQADCQKSIEYADLALASAREINDNDLEIEAIIGKAYAYIYHSDFEQAKIMADEVFKFGVNNESPNQMGTGYNIKGRISYLSGEISLALEYYLKALDCYLKEPKADNLMSCYNNLGTCYIESRNLPEALNYFQLALDEAEKIGFAGKDIIRLNMGCLQYEEKDFKAALDSFQTAAAYFEKHNMLNYLSDAYLNIGMTLFDLGNEDEGRNYYRKSYAMKKEINDLQGMCKVSHIIGNSLLDLEKSDEAYGYFLQAKNIAEEHNLSSDKITVYEDICRYWEQKNNFEELSKNQKTLMTLSKEMNANMSREKISEMEAKYKTEIYKLQTRELNAKNKAMSEQIEKLHQMHKQLKQEFEESARRLNEQDDLLSSQSRMALMGEMVSLIAHQWRQPLNVIGVLVQSFEDAWEFNEMSAEYIEKQVKLIMSQILYMSETINDFRNFFKSDLTGEFDLKEVIAKSMQLLDYSLQKAGIHFTLEMVEDCRLSGNPNEIVQVILNIVNNARDAMLSDNISEPEIKLSLNRNETQYEIRIFNKGNQIKSELKDKLFEPYFSTKGKDGTGIGLYICKMIVEHKYNGTIEVFNQEAGVEFVIKIPCVSLDEI